MAGKYKYWVGVLYPENMVDKWEDTIGDILELPYAYCIHDKDLDKDGDERKEHVHLMIAFPNPTTEHHATFVFKKLGVKALNKIQNVIHVRHMYNYLIHDTETCRKQGKHQYEPSERKCGNNFDIGAYEQIGQQEKNQMARELTMMIFSKGYTNYADFCMDVISNFDDEYMDIVKGNSGHFDRLIKGMYHKSIEADEKKLRQAKLKKLQVEGFADPV